MFIERKVDDLFFFVFLEKLAADARRVRGALVLDKPSSRSLHAEAALALRACGLGSRRDAILPVIILKFSIKTIFNYSRRSVLR